MLLPILLATLSLPVAAASGPAPPETTEPTPSIRVAVFNIWELSAAKVDTVDPAGRGSHPQLRHAAEIIQLLRPDLLLVNEIDHDPHESVAERFLDRYLRVPQAGLVAIDYPHIVDEAVNTGVPSGHDFNNDGDADDPEDAWGFGRYPGQYGMALYSRFPVDRASLRTFRTLRWSAMPGNLLPDGGDGRPSWYSADEAAVFRLSSKSHWDIPVEIDGAVLHLLASHPTPAVFDGDEDRTGRRNHDEIRLWADYLHSGDVAAWIVDDQGRPGGLAPSASFVLLGDLNADPLSAGPLGRPAIAQLLDHPRIQDPKPRCEGERQPRRPYAGDPKTLTSDYGRIDFALPSRDLQVLDAGVFWPTPDDPRRPLVEGKDRASDHQAVWIDIAWPAASEHP